MESWILKKQTNKKNKKIFKKIKKYDSIVFVVIRNHKKNIKYR